MKAVMDSDVLIDFLQGDTRAAQEIERYNDLRYSVISWMEVMCGAETEPEKAAAKGFLASMRVIELSSQIAHLAVEARRKHRLKLPDAVIWATADSEGCILVTRNTKDFDKDHPMIRIPTDFFFPLAPRLIFDFSFQASGISFPFPLLS